MESPAADATRVDGYDEILVSRSQVSLLLAEDLKMSATIVEYEMGEWLALKLPYAGLRRAKVGSTLNVAFGRDGDASYTFETAVRSIDTSKFRVYLAWPETVERHQARRHVRLPVSLEASFAAWQPGVAKSTDLDWIDGRVTNVSGSGVALAATVELPIGSVVVVRCQLPARRDPVLVEDRAQVVRASDTQYVTEDGVVFPFHHGLEWVELSPRREEEIVAAVAWSIVRTRVS